MKTHTLWKGFLAAVLAAAMIGQTVLAQNGSSESKVQEEVGAKEVQVTGIRTEGRPYYSTWTTGDVRCIDSFVVMEVAQGMNLIVSYSDGSEVKIADSVSQWVEKGVEVVIKDKSSGVELPMDYKFLQPGSYELYLYYQGYSCKATDFTIKAVEEAVDAVISTESNTAVYSADPDSFRKTVTKFVADEPGSYTFKGIREDVPDWKIFIEIRDAETYEQVKGVYDSSLSLYLEAGAYYVKITSGYGFTVAVEKKDASATGINVSGDPLYDTWTTGDVNADEDSILVNVVQGMRLMQICDDGTEIEVLSSGSITRWTSKGVTVVLKNKDDGSTVDLDGKMLKPGNYEVYLGFQGFECKAIDLTVKEVENTVDGTITLDKNSVTYNKENKQSKKTVTKFVAETPGLYTFQVKNNGNTDEMFNMKLYNKDIIYMKSHYSSEPLELFLKKGTYYLKLFNGDTYTVSVSGKEISSMSMEEPGETERLYLIGNLDNWGQVAGANKENVNSLYARTKVHIDYKDGSSDTEKLSELISSSWDFIGWGERIWNIMTGEPGGTSRDPLNIGIYELQYWSDTSSPMTDENAALNYNFIIYKGFQDVSLTDWFVYPVAYTSAAGMMTGMGDGTNFEPSENLSRAQFATILYRMEGSEEVDYKEVFPDVKDGEFYTNAVLWANENKVVTGYGDTGTFGPADNITREQMAVMMYRFAQYKGYDVSESTELDSFPDYEKVSEFAQKAMKWASATGLIRGDQGNINPQGNASRAQCATIMMRFSEMY